MQVQEMKFFKISRDSVIMIEREKANGIFIVLSSVKSFIKEREKLTGENYCCMEETFQEIINYSMCKVIPEVCSICEKIEVDTFYYVTNKKTNESSLVYCYMLKGKKVLGFNVNEGAGIVPICDLSPDCILSELTIIAHNERGIVCIQ